MDRGEIPIEHEIAGSPRNSFRASVVERVMEVEH